MTLSFWCPRSGPGGGLRPRTLGVPGPVPWEPDDLGWNPALPLIGCVTSGNFLNLSEPWFPFLYVGLIVTLLLGSL